MNLADHVASVRSHHHRHARLRAAERYDLSLADDDLDAMASRILAGAEDIVRLRRGVHFPHRVKVAVLHAGEWLPTVFDEGERSIVTILPEVGLKGYRGYLRIVLRKLKVKERRRARRARAEAGAAKVGGPLEAATTGPSTSADMPAVDVAEPYDGPPVGTILGRVEVRPGSFLDLKWEREERKRLKAEARLKLRTEAIAAVSAEVSPVPCRTIAEAQARHVRLKASMKAIHEQLANGKFGDCPYREKLMAKMAAASEERRDLGVAMYESERLFYVTDDAETLAALPSEPLPLLIAAHAMIRGLIKGKGNGPDDPTVVLCHKIRDYLRENAPLIGGTEKATEGMLP